MSSLTIGRVIAGLVAAFLCGLVIATVYRLTFKGESYSASYVQSLIAFAMITTIVITVIGNNLARAFGLVGSMSIIRFRMAIKDTKDIVFIFFTLAIGMAAGVGLYSIAIIATLFISAIILLLSVIDFAAPHREHFLLNFYFESEDTENAPYLPAFREFCKRHRLVNIRSIEGSSLVELSYALTLKKHDSIHLLIRRLEEIEGITNIGFFFDEV